LIEHLIFTLLGLHSIEHLILHQNNLTSLPSSINTLVTLKTVSFPSKGNANANANANAITQAQAKLNERQKLNPNKSSLFLFFYVKNLFFFFFFFGSQLYLGENRLTELPDLSNLKELEELDASVNKLTYLSKTIGQLSSLQELTLSDNRLRELPQEIANLHNLSCLNVRHNRLHFLPAEILSLPHLTQVNVSSNPFWGTFEVCLFNGTVLPEGFQPQKQSTIPPEGIVVEDYMIEEEEDQFMEEEEEEEEEEEDKEISNPSPPTLGILSLKEECGRLILRAGLPFNSNKVPHNIRKYLADSHRCTLCGDFFLQIHWETIKMYEAWHGANTPFLYCLCHPGHLKAI